MAKNRGNWKCDHKGAVKKQSYSIHGTSLSVERWCTLCQGWVDRMEKG